MNDTRAYIERWAADPEGGARFPERRDALLAHDPNCRSLNRAWTPRARGSVCPSDLADCEDCDVVFFIEGLGLYEINGEDTELCDCCARKQGVA
ncbi:MAG: hypothetical protein HOY69_18975 [Streptomyces sp.]|nr:hypothetical protein [Streptomyces sp.]